MTHRSRAGHRPSSVPRRRRGPRWGRTALLAAAAVAAAVLPVGAASGQSTDAPRDTQRACPDGETARATFTDAAGPFEAAIRCVAAYGVTRGVSATSTMRLEGEATFAPARTVTRGQLASFTRALLDVGPGAGLPLGGTDTRYRDVSPDDVHAPAIDALSRLDPPVLEGFDDGTFRPQERVSRAQAASILDRALAVRAPDLGSGAGTGCTFTDADRIAPVHRDAVDRACRRGIVAGRDDGRFDPGASLQRGAAAALLGRSLDVLTEHGTLVGPLGVRTLATGLSQPWEVVVTEADRTFVTERRGRLLEVVDGEVVERRRFDVVDGGEGGLLGLVEVPDGGGELLAYLTTDVDSRVVRFDPDDDAAAEPVLTGIPAHVRHNGGRLAIGPDGMLYVATGDVADNVPESQRPTEEQMVAQDVGSLAGKILRLELDGSVPADNPFGNEVWSLGHRNVQGLSWDADGRLWATELGPDRADEINVIDRGANYGWPLVQGTDTTSTPQGTSRPAAFVAAPAEASWSGAAFTIEATGFAGPGELLVAALRGQRVWQLTTDGAALTADRQRLVEQLGRLRTVVPSGDGGVLVLTAQDDGRLVRVGP